MKNLVKMIAVLAIMFSTYTCRTITPVTNAVFLSEREGTITVRSSGIGNTQEKAQIAAEQNAFNTLFFRGFPNSSQKTPLIDYNEASIKQQYNTYFDELYGKSRRYRTFVIYSQAVGDYTNKLQNVEISINLRALRSDLEHAGVIRKFGY